jgi:hypothetical protein
MALTTIQGTGFLLKLSPDNWTTTYTVVCLTNQGMNRERDVNVTATQCGTASGRGPIKRSIDATLVVNTTPAAVASGVGEASYKLLETWIETDTALLFKRESPVGSGTDIYQVGTCWLTKMNDSAAVGEKMVCDITLTIDGDLDLTPPSP